VFNPKRELERAYAWRSRFKLFFVIKKYQEGEVKPDDKNNRTINHKIIRRNARNGEGREVEMIDCPRSRAQGSKTITRKVS
jgi:hypothetical protein